MNRTLVFWRRIAAHFQYGVILMAVCSIFVPARAFAKSPGQQRLAKVNRIATNDKSSVALINSIYASFFNNGDGGSEYPNGSGKSTIYEDGLVWGGYSKGSLKVGGSTYSHGLQAGRILISGTISASPLADNPTLPQYRVFRVRPDVTPQTLLADVATMLQDDESTFMIRTSQTVQQIYNQYVQDWNEWPASQGAPFQDKNGNGIYDPSTDVPGIPGASQTLWFVSNDLDASRTYSLAGSSPIGLEFQRTIWAYRSFGRLGNAVFVRNVLINKSGVPIDSMFIAQWSDPDLGDAFDDFAGCDTSLGLGYAYNSKVDAVFGAAVPAVGYKLLAGPIVPGVAGDSAFAKFGFRPNYRNLMMSSFNIFISGNPNYNDPAMGNYNGTLQWFNLMKGLVGVSGAPYVNPITGQPSKYVFSGDPVGSFGWLDGTIAPAGDRRISLSTGPFTMAAGDTQEVVVALITGQGKDRLSSVTELKKNAGFSSNFTTGGIAEMAISNVDTLLPFQSKVAFEASVIRFTGQTVDATWFLSQKPFGSTASMNVLSTLRAELQTDVAGNYRVGFVAVSNTGTHDTVFSSFRVSANQAPTAGFSPPTSITLGDTLKLDGSQSSDPDGNLLTYKWTITGGASGSYEVIPGDTVAGIFGNMSSVQTTYVPLRASILTLRLEASDAEFTEGVTKTVIVNPRKTSNVTTEKVFGTGYLNAPYFGAFTIRNFGNIIWARLGGDLYSLDFGPATQPSIHLSGLFGGNYFVVSPQLIYSANGRFGVQIAFTDGTGYVTNQTAIDPDNSTINKPDTTAWDVHVYNNRLYFAYGLPGLYVYDVSNPNIPAFVQQLNNGSRWTNLIADGNRLFTIHTANRKLSVVNIANPNLAAIEGNYDFSWGVTKLAMNGNILVAMNPDTIQLFDVSNLAAIVPHALWLTPKGVRSDNRFTDVAAKGNYLVVGTYEGTYIYDISNIDAPTIQAQWLTGIYQGRVFYNGSKLLVSVSDRFGGDSPVRPYPLIELQVQSVTTDVPMVAGQQLPTAFRLDQNYPNPFNPTTTIRFDLPMRSKVRLLIFNVLGQQVEELANEEVNAGQFQKVWNAAKFPSGVYFCRMVAGTFTATRKILLAK